MTKDLRRLFDRLLDEEVTRLPPQFRAALDEVPLIVDDEPTAELLAEMGMAPDEDLCGLHQGTPLTERHADAEFWPDQLRLFRGPIIDQADYPDEDYPDAAGSEDDLRREIHITLLHEIGHHFGLDEDDLARLGYA